MSKSLYLLIVSVAFVLPLVASFSRQFLFVRYWRGAFFGIAVMLLMFLPWNVWFVSKEIWTWNPEHILGPKIANLPWETVLYHIAIPFGFVYLYEFLKQKAPFALAEKVERGLTAIIVFLCFILSILFVDRLYTFTACSLLSLFLIWHLLVQRSDYLSKFYFAFLVFQIPLFLVEGCLTGLFHEQAIISYNANEILGLNILTIPLEAYIYDMLMLLMVITAYENFKVKHFSGALNVSG